MTAPAELSAGWALFGKPPGSAQDYAVIASSGWPLAVQHFEKVIRAYSPGEVPAHHGSPPNAFPWATFTYLRLDADLYRGMAITDWSGDVDRTGRPIAETFYCCLRARDDDPWPGFAATYRACLSRRGDWTALEQHQAGQHQVGQQLPLPLPVAVEDPAARLQPLPDQRLEQVAEAAAALLDGRQVVFQLGRSPLPLPERLELLDSVRSLLPAGARHWLSAGTWWDVGRRRGPEAALCLSDRGGENSHVIGGGHHRTLSPNARRYRDLLLQLLHTHGPEAVTARLATGLHVQARDPLAGLDLVREVDLVAVTAREIEAGEVSVGNLSRLIDEGLLDELPPEVRTRAIGFALANAEPAQLPSLRPFLDGDTYPALVDAAQGRLWRDGWAAGQLQPFLDLARGVHALDDLLARLCASRKAPAERGGVAASLLDGLGPAGAEVRVRRLLASDPMLTLRVVRLAPDVPTARRWLEIWHEEHRQLPGPTVAGAPNAEAALRALAFASGRPVQPSEDDVAALGGLFGVPGVEQFVGICRNGRPQDVVRIVEVLVLRWLYPHADEMTEPQIRWWLDVLGPQRSESPPLEALSDVLRARWGRPRTDIAEVVWQPDSRPGLWAPYAVELERLIAALPPERSLQIVDLWASGLRPGWSRPRERRDVVLRLLWRLVHAADRQAPVSRDLLSRIVKELGPDGEWRHDPAIGPWRRELARHPKLIVGLLEADLAELPPDTSATVAAEKCVEIMLINRDPARTADLLALAGLPDEEVGQLLTAMVNRWPYNLGPVSQFIDRFIDVAGQRSPGLRGRLAGEALESLQSGSVILSSVAEPVSALTAADRARVLEELQVTQRCLDRIRGELEDEGSLARSPRKWFGANRRGQEQPPVPS